MSERPAIDAAQLFDRWRDTPAPAERVRLAENLLLQYADLLTSRELDDLLFEHMAGVLGKVTPQKVEGYLNDHHTALNLKQSLRWQVIENGFRLNHDQRNGPDDVSDWAKRFKEHEDALRNLARLLDTDQTDRHRRYTRLRKVGEGGFGTVYLAEHRYLHEHYAVKVLRRDRLPLEGDAERFLEEARHTMQLRGHPHIVSALDAGFDGEEAYIVFPFIGRRGVPCENLFQRCCRGPLDPVVAAEIVATVATAVHYAHIRGIYHRDIKTSNILIDELGKAWLTDFGLATVARGEEGAVTRRGGTLIYMAPEEVEGTGKIFPVLTDVYSLGVTLYEILAGTPAFSAPADSELKERIQQGKVTTPLHLLARIPPKLADICARAMHVEPCSRYLGAQEMALALQEVVADLSQASKPRPSNSWGGWTRGSSRNPPASAAIPFLDGPSLTPARATCQCPSGKTTASRVGAVSDPQVKTMSRAFTLASINDLVETRVEVELATFRDGQVRSKPSDIEQLQATIEAMNNARTEGNVASFARADMEFHLIVAQLNSTRLSGNILNTLQSVFLVQELILTSDASVMNKAIIGHNRILRCLRKETQTATYRAVRKHVYKARSNWTSLMVGLTAHSRQGRQLWVPDDLRSLTCVIAMRGVLEDAAVKDLARAKLPSSGLAKLHRLLGQQREEAERGNVHKLAMLDIDFHATIVGMSRLSAPRSWFARIRKQVQALLNISFAIEGAIESCLVMHEMILDALSSYRLDLAAELLASHCKQDVDLWHELTVTSAG